MNSKEILIRLYKTYTSKYLNKIIIAGFFSILVAGSTSAVAYLLDPAIKKIFIDQDQTLIYLIPIAIISAFSIKGFSLYFAKTNMIHVAEHVKKNIQSDMVKSLINADTKIIDDKHTGKIVSNLTVDTNVIVNLVSVVLLNLFKDSVTLIGLLFVMFYQNWKLALFSLIMMPLSAFVAKSLGKRIAKATTKGAVASGKLATMLTEILRGYKIIKIYQREHLEKERAAFAIKDMVDKDIKIGKIMIRATPVMEILLGIMIATFIYYSGFLIAKGEIGINNFFSFLAAMMLSYQPVRSLATLNMAVYQGATAAERVFKILDEKIQIVDQKKLPEIKIKNAEIQFKNVSFQYKSGKDSAVKNIDLNIDGGKVTALVGHSGAGKSTIMNLIPRFYQQQKGRILIDGQSINEISLYSLRNKISLVSQDIVLFDDSVENNIKYAKFSATQNEIKNACELAASTEFIEELPERYKTIIGENGVRLSGGQKQRLSIARAILKNAPIILLDEATSSLDAESEEKVQNAIFNLTKNKTTLVIAHRLSTIKKADKIIVMKNGNIVGSGKHEELLKESKDYENLYSKQVV